MKKINYIPLLAFSLLLLAAGCRQAEFEDPAEGGHILTASLERGADTKTHFGDPIDDIYYPYWTAEDELAVYVDALSFDDKYTLTAGAGTEKGSFSGRVSGNHYVALYPYADRVNEGLKGNALSLVLPSEQSYAPGSFGEGAFPMLAVGGEDGLAFKNLCSVLRISVTGDKVVRAVHFVAHDGQMYVSGPATVRTDYAAVPELVMSDGGSPRVTVKCPGVQLKEDEPVDFFIVIPPGTYKEGFSVEVETFSGTFTREVSSDITFGRSQFRYIKPFRADADGEIDPDDIPYNQIWYVTGNNSVYNPPVDAFDRTIVSNTYKEGKGVIVFDGPVTKVGNRTFVGGNIKEIILPNTVETLEEEAIAITGIDSFHTPANLKTFYSNSLYACWDLKRYYGPHATTDEKGLVLEGNLIAYAMASLEETLVIPEGVTSIAARLFTSQEGIKHIIFPEGLRSLGEFCFGFCSSLETVTIPESLDSMADYVFYQCYSLREFKGKNDMIPDGHAIVDSQGYLKAFAGAGIVDYTIPEGVIGISSCLQNWPSLHSVTIPESLKYYTYPPFKGCENLEFFYGANTTPDHHLFYLDVELAGVTPLLPKVYRMPSGYGITYMFYAFDAVRNVERLIIDDAVQFMSLRAFGEMPQLKSLRLPASATDLEDPFYGTNNLDTLYVRSYAPPIFTESEGSHMGHDGLVICVPRGMEDLYKAAPTWSKYAKYIKGYNYKDLPAPDYYLSKDYSHDGKVTMLQKAKKGRGIDIVLMGDAFSDRQIADGTYNEVMHKMMEAFFSEEPYTSYRNLFNVYSVEVVSPTEGYENRGQALGGWFGEGTEVGGSDDRCIEYALGAVSEDRMDNTLIIVAMNSTKYAGTCWMHDSVSGETLDYGCGTSVAYFPVGDGEEGLARLVHHEAGGHGFAKLADEYAYEYMGTIPQTMIDGYKYKVPFGWWKNGDFTNDPNMVKWARFLADERYQYDGLGCFEGAFTYWKGAWRPTDNSIMRYNTGGFNAPSREAIWYRMNKLAYGDSWNYDYEAFVAYDAVNRKTAASSASSRRYAPEKPFTPTAPPVLTGTTWKEELQTRPDRRPKIER